MDDFASTALFNLIATALSQKGIHATPVRQFGGKIDRRSKLEILNQATRELGPAGILAIGQGMRGPAFDPVTRILRQAASPADMFSRWQRLEQYFHSHHRTRVCGQAANRKAANRMELEHYALAGPGPSEGEDLLIAGVLAALLQQTGVIGLGLTIDGERAITGDQINANLPHTNNSRVWIYHWDGFSPQRPEAPQVDEAASLVDRVSTLLLNDPGRSWRLEAIAGELAISTRSLQRQLAARQTNFQNLLRVSRTDAAAALLNESEDPASVPLAAVGYATGFSDQAHFSREFKLRFNMSPSDYLAMSQARD